jgi:cell wall-associated NlpC family hydrolase
MNPLALVLIVAGAFAMRQTIVGRASDIPGDLKDSMVALLSGNTSDLKTVMSRRGNSTGTAVSNGVDGSSANLTAVPSLPQSGNTIIAAECVNLGSKAKGYRLGAEGPDFYDCSGLVWAAMRKIGLYNGPRFTTATFEQVAPRVPMYKVATPTAGDVAIWVAHGHMGVMLSNTDFYSARSPSAGIGMAPISADIQSFGATPDYWRLGTQQTSNVHSGGSQTG